MQAERLGAVKTSQSEMAIPPVRSGAVFCVPGVGVVGRAMLERALTAKADGLPREDFGYGRRGSQLPKLVRLGLVTWIMGTNRYRLTTRALEMVGTQNAQITR